MEEALGKKDTDLGSYAKLVDKLLWLKGKKQIYGTQIASEGKIINGKYVVEKEKYLWPVEDPENLNKRRAELSLEPIEEYLKKMGVQ